MRTASLIVSRVPGLSSTMRIVPESFIGNFSYWTVAPSRILLETTLAALFVYIRRRTRSLTNRHGSVLARDGTAEPLWLLPPWILAFPGLSRRRGRPLSPSERSTEPVWVDVVVFGLPR